MGQIDWGVIASLLNLALLGVSAVGGLIMKGLREDIRMLREADLKVEHDVKQASADITALRVMVAGSYVTREEFRSSFRDFTDTISGRIGELIEATERNHITSR